jgi:hypothetical protein
MHSSNMHQPIADFALLIKDQACGSVLGASQHVHTIPQTRDLPEPFWKPA